MLWTVWIEPFCRSNAGTHMITCHQISGKFGFVGHDRHETLSNMGQKCLAFPPKWDISSVSVNLKMPLFNGLLRDKKKNKR